jgi:hypothetical protein
MSMENNFGSGSTPEKRDPQEHHKTFIGGKWRNTSELTEGEDGKYIEPKIYKEDLERYNELEEGYEVTYKNQQSGEVEEGVVVRKDDETYKVFIGPKGMDKNTEYGVAINFDDMYMIRKPKENKESLD